LHSAQPNDPASFDETFMTNNPAQEDYDRPDLASQLSLSLIIQQLIAEMESALLVSIISHSSKKQETSAECTLPKTRNSIPLLNII
jgi:hypothetical protein